MGPDMQTQNYLYIGKNSVVEQNSSRYETSPAPFRGGGMRGWVPIKRRENFGVQLKFLLYFFRKI